MRDTSRVAGLVVAAAVAAGSAGAASVPSPKDVLGLDVGQDRALALYSESERYLEALAAASDRVEPLAMGPTVEGRTMRALAISSPANLARIDELRRGWARLADPRGLTAAERERLLAGLPSCALITAGIHGNEVAGPQAALLFAHRLAAAAPGSAEAAWLERTVVLLVPSLNPDGQEMVVGWYRKWLGTPHEGSGFPALYHRYTGHDNNRDFVYLTQPESRALNRLAYREWRPQVFLDVHQMGPLGPRQFVPPFADPIAPNVHPLVWRVTSHLGTLMSLRLEENGRAGVISGWTFDGNWIGGTRNTGWWKNVFGVLTETAGAALASPIDIDPGELRAGGKGLVDYRQQVNFPHPWQGGRWGLAQAVAYQLDVMAAFVEFASTYRADLLGYVSEMAAQAVAQGESEAPRAYLVPPNPADPGRSRALVELLVEAGVEGFVAPQGVSADGRAYPPGTAVFPTAQPLRQYLVEVLERQEYPEISPAPGADILLPYDITAWSMPLAFGVEAVRAETAPPAGRLEPIAAETLGPAGGANGRGAWAVAPAGQLGGFAFANGALARGGTAARLTGDREADGRRFAAGSFVVGGLDDAAVEALARESGVRVERVATRPASARELRPVKVGVLHPHWGLEDAGWLRFVLERAGFAVEAIAPEAVAAGSLARRVGVLVIPAMDGRRLVEGPGRGGAVAPPPEFRTGIGREGVEAVKAFHREGGTVLAFGASADWLAEALDLPVSNTLRGVSREEFSCPGAMLEVEVETGTPLGWGMPGRAAAMIDDGAAFQTRPTAGETARVVAARFPDRPLLLSGWIRGEERMRRRAAVVEVRQGEGRAVLYAFAPHFRAQMRGTFPLLFNAVTEEMMDAPAPKPGRR
ncbi:MAG: M14 metallopeptidase family protein [Acidobacteriota bacterium]